MGSAVGRRQQHKKWAGHPLDDCPVMLVSG